MPLEILGILHYCDHSEARPLPFSEFDPAFIRDCARAHEASGFDRVLIANSAHRPDSIPIAAYAAAVTERLQFMIAHRPGFVAPTMAARMLATIDRLSGGRCGVHIITGADDRELEADGDFLTKEKRYERSGEYVRILREVWGSAEPFDHAGQFYQVNGGHAYVRPAQPKGIPIFWGGSSNKAIEIGAELADIYALPGHGQAMIAALIAKVTAQAAKYGRKPEFLISTRVIVGATEADAWRRAHAILRYLIEEVVDNGRLERRPAETRAAAIERGMAMASEGALDGRVWSALTKAPTGRPAINCLVGGCDALIETLLQYRRMGVTRFILSGYDPIADAIEMGRAFLPRLREAMADAADDGDAPQDE